jgi:hypothetical protein
LMVVTWWTLLVCMDQAAWAEIADIGGVQFHGSNSSSRWAG